MNLREKYEEWLNTFNPEHTYKIAILADRAALAKEVGRVCVKGVDKCHDIQEGFRRGDAITIINDIYSEIYELYGKAE